MFLCHVYVVVLAYDIMKKINVDIRPSARWYAPFPRPCTGHPHLSSVVAFRCQSVFSGFSSNRIEDEQLTTMAAKTFQRRPPDNKQYAGFREHIHLRNASRPAGLPWPQVPCFRKVYSRLTCRLCAWPMPACKWVTRRKLSLTFFNNWLRVKQKPGIQHKRQFTLHLHCRASNTPVICRQ